MCTEKAEDSYYTIEDKALGQYNQQRSKFIAYAIPIQSVEDAMLHIKELKSKYYDARHHCWAYRLGHHGEEFRANDDGEPSGTAGKPILGQLISADLSNILVVVIRYFGGVKLGTSGLIEAYRSACIDALENSIRKLCILETQIEVSFSYELMGEVMRIIKDRNANIYLQDFQESCRLELSIRQKEAEPLLQQLNNLYGCQAKDLSSSETTNL